jgi:hypothetical protein
MANNLNELKTFCIAHFTQYKTINGLYRKLSFNERTMLTPLVGRNFKEKITTLIYGGIYTCTYCNRKILAENGPLVDHTLGYCYRHTKVCVVCGDRHNRKGNFSSLECADNFEKCPVIVVQDPDDPDVTPLQPIDISLTLFELGDSFLENDYVKYLNVTGDLNEVTIPYVLRAKTNLPSYSTFDILDWDVVYNHTWVGSRTSFERERFDIFPGDTLFINGEEKVLNNFHNGVVKSQDLLQEFGTIYNRQLGLGASSVQLKPGFNLFTMTMPIVFEEESYGIVDNSLFNGKGYFSILLDNFPTEFEVYFKLQVVGNPLVRTVYPEVSTYVSIVWTFAAANRALVENSDFSSFNWQNFPQTFPSFSANGDFCYMKFWKTADMPKVRFQKFGNNTTPTFS